jgi:SAM-dependent methyltransferase
MSDQENAKRASNVPAREPVNAFAHATVAERYARGRPYYHPIVIDQIWQMLGLNSPVPRALDVGCGTGQSTLALLDLAQEVVGIDPSPAMLAHAPHDPRLTFIVALAEDLPFPDNSFDLITVAAAFHWLDRERFLAEAARALRPAAWLVPYDNAFFGVMEDQPDFADWVREVYAAHYPSPPRDRRPLTEEVDHFGFHLRETKRYTNTVIFTPGELVAYLLTQSNIVAAVEEGRESVEEVATWLISEVTPLFPGPRATFRFGGTVTYLQKR